MIEKRCHNCIYGPLDGIGKPCDSCVGYSKYLPDELYAAYLAEKARADEAEALLGEQIGVYTDLHNGFVKLQSTMRCDEKYSARPKPACANLQAENAKLRQALNCPSCNGRGGWTQLVTEEWHICPKCADIRKEARGE